MKNYLIILLVFLISGCSTISKKDMGTSYDLGYAGGYYDGYYQGKDYGFEIGKIKGRIDQIYEDSVKK